MYFALPSIFPLSMCYLNVCYFISLFFSPPPLPNFHWCYFVHCVSKECLCVDVCCVSVCSCVCVLIVCAKRVCSSVLPSTLYYFLSFSLNGVNLCCSYDFSPSVVDFLHSPIPFLYPRSILIPSDITRTAYLHCPIEYVHFFFLNFLGSISSYDGPFFLLSFFSGLHLFLLLCESFLSF